MPRQRLTREYNTVSDTVFVVMPYGTKPDPNGEPFDFDHMYDSVLVPTITDAGMTAHRADTLHGGDTLLELVWRGIQQAGIVLSVCSAESSNVSLELGWAYMIGKKMIFLAQDMRDVPSDMSGLRSISYSSHFRAMDRMRHDLRAALDALRDEPANEMMLVPMPVSGSSPAPGKVLSATAEHAFICTDDGRLGVLSNADVDYARIIPDMAAKYPVGSRVNGAFRMSPQGDMRYTLLAGATNPWPLLEAGYPEGRVFVGPVQNVLAGTGAFVRIAHDVNGLVPYAQLPTEPPLVRGELLEVAVVSLDAAKRRVQLRYVRRMKDPAPGHAASHTPARPNHGPAAPTPIGAARSAGAPMPKVGDVFDGEVVRIHSEGDGGYVLLQPEGSPRRVLLHCTAMSAELREDLNAGQLEQGDLVRVRVLTANPGNGRVTVAEVPEDDLDDADDTTPHAESA